ncbi:glutamyl-tRNA amidotransferase subunit [Grosmannia clavigera kw1407]|uniref:Glutamyl-tRNA amidotransferase subunit n=1 Tax=Grosmannia clavigera (strain kw1407 / UAMH 11150) TaxID=655863 RepID=F0XH78_GROCL|nr:glutamyl-tRNA amidotransferase subunit [Grosmannia clavigera kw1407]EFX03136.1 glutamyl-tRNA amidotransferase subunit [Grosmannia clavigera kw1407]
MVFDKYISRLETFLGIVRSTIDLGTLWLETNPEGVDTPLDEYFAHVFDWAANPDQWSGFLKDFVESYEAKEGKLPVLNPQLRFKRQAFLDYIPTITVDQQAESVRLLKIYQQWFYSHVIPVDEARPIAGTTPYKSKYTNKTEQLPAALGIVGSKGSDIMLAELISALDTEGAMISNAEVDLR